MSHDYDVIIVGQGLAGSLLAYNLLKEKQRVLVLNDESLQTSSDVAAGIYNPITSKRLTRTWLLDELFPFLEKYYLALETELGKTFLHQSKVYRPFDSIEQQNHFLSQTERLALGKYITDKVDNQKYNKLIFNDLDGIETNFSGWVDIPMMLASLRTYFLQHQAYLPEKYNASQLILPAEPFEEIHYKNFVTKKIIFCEGFYGQQNPLFSWLQWNPVKGEVLTLEVDGYDLSEIVNQGIFILPTDKNIVRIGATYEWNELTWQPTEAAKLQLTEKLNKLLRVPYKIVEQKAGIRPATQDRRPFLGMHPKYRNIGIFNGLGTKGVSLAPYFAHEFTDFLMCRKDLMSDVNIERNYSLFLS